MSVLVTADTYIHYVVTINGNSYSVSYSGGKLSYNAIIPNEDLCFFKEVWVAESRSAIAPLSSQGTLAKNAYLGFFFNETFTEFDNATDAIKHFDLNYIGLDMNVERGGNNQKKFILKPKGSNYSSFELRHASSGIQTTAPLIAMMNYYAQAFDFKLAQKRSIIDLLFEKNLTTQYRPEMELTDMPKYVHIHIEEPELSLDPTSQIQMLNEIIRLAFYSKVDSREIGLVLATHSPYIINSLNLLMKAHDCKTDIDGAHVGYDDLSVYQILSGGVADLKVKNIHYVNTDRLSEDDENTTSLSEFDLTEDNTQFVVGYKEGYASFCGNPFNLSVVNYDTYIGRYTGTKISDGKRRCDFILTDTDTYNIILLCEVTSSIGGIENLSRPIEKTQKDGTRTVVFR